MAYHRPAKRKRQEPTNQHQPHQLLIHNEEVSGSDIITSEILEAAKMCLRYARERIVSAKKAQASAERTYQDAKEALEEANIEFGKASCKEEEAILFLNKMKNKYQRQSLSVSDSDGDGDDYYDEKVGSWYDETNKILLNRNAKRKSMTRDRENRNQSSKKVATTGHVSDDDTKRSKRNSTRNTNEEDDNDRSHQEDENEAPERTHMENKTFKSNKSTTKSTSLNTIKQANDSPAHCRIREFKGKYRLTTYIPWLKKNDGRSSFFIKDFPAKTRADKSQKVIENLLNSKGYTFEAAKQAAIEAGMKDDNKRSTNLNTIKQADNPPAYGSIRAYRGNHRLTINIPWLKKNGRSQFFVKDLPTKSRAKKAQEVIEDLLNSQAYTFEAAKQAGIEAGMQDDIEKCNDGSEIESESESGSESDSESGSESDTDDEGRDKFMDRISIDDIPKGSKPGSLLVQKKRRIYYAKRNDTPTQISERYNVPVRTLLFDNAAIYPELKRNTILEPCNTLVLPLPEDSNDNEDKTEKQDPKKLSSNIPKANKIDENLSTQRKTENQLAIGHICKDRKKHRVSIKIPWLTPEKKCFHIKSFDTREQAIAAKEVAEKLLNEDGKAFEHAKALSIEAGTKVGELAHLETRKRSNVPVNETQINIESEDTDKMAASERKNDKGYVGDSWKDPPANGQKICTINSNGGTDKDIFNTIGTNVDLASTESNVSTNKMNENDGIKTPNDQPARGKINKDASRNLFRLDIRIPWKKNARGGNEFYIKRFDARLQAELAKNVAEKLLNQDGFTYEVAKKAAIDAAEIAAALKVADHDIGDHDIICEDTNSFELDPTKDKTATPTTSTETAKRPQIEAAKKDAVPKDTELDMTTRDPQERQSFSAETNTTKNTVTTQTASAETTKRATTGDGEKDTTTRDSDNIRNSKDSQDCQTPKDKVATQTKSVLIANRSSTDVQKEKAARMDTERGKTPIETREMHVEKGQAAIAMKLKNKEKSVNSERPQVAESVHENGQTIAASNLPDESKCNELLPRSKPQQCSKTSQNLEHNQGNVIEADSRQQLRFPIGTRVQKQCAGFSLLGKVTGYDANFKEYSVQYEDGNESEFGDEEDLRKIVIPFYQHSEKASLSANSTTIDKESNSHSAVVDNQDIYRIPRKQATQPLISTNVSHEPKQVETTSSLIPASRYAYSNYSLAKKE